MENKQTVSRSEVIKLVSEKTGKTQVDVKTIVSAVEDVITGLVKGGKEVTLTGFLSIKPKTTKARKGRNPKTGAELNIPAKKSVSVSVSKGFKDTVNGTN